jgi:hypothetical protein
MQVDLITRYPQQALLRGTPRSRIRSTSRKSRIKIALRSNTGTSTTDRVRREFMTGGSSYAVGASLSCGRGCIAWFRFVTRLNSALRVRNDSSWFVVAAHARPAGRPETICTRLKQTATPRKVAVSKERRCRAYTKSGGNALFHGAGYPKREWSGGAPQILRRNLSNK